MKLHVVTALLASSGIACSAPAYAQDVPVAAGSTDAAKMEMLEAQIASMQDQLNSLKEGLTKVTPSKDKPAWYADTKISGKAYFNTSHISQKSDGVTQPTTGTETELKRFYISVDHKFNDMFSADLTTDFRYGSNGLSNDVSVYVKKAYLQAKFSDAAVLRVGAADLPWVPFAEKVYGFRHIEQVVIDRTKYGSSTDWGLHLGGKFADGKVEYAVSAINGLGNKTLARKSDHIDLEGRISANPVSFITLGVGAYSGKLGKQAGGAPDTPHTATRFNALAAYTGKRATLGVEYFTAKNWKNVDKTSSDKTNGWSAFGSFNVNDKWALFGRYDWVNPDKISNPGLKENYFNVGAQYTPVKGVDVALVYKRDSARNGFISTGNGTIGGVDKGTYDEIGVFGQFKF